jgi:hypothetical protein
MDHINEMESRLWEYIDGTAAASDRSAIEKLIEEHSEWRVKYKELLEVHQLLQSSELEEPSLRFTKNVMEEIAKFQVAPATRQYINSKIIWGIGFFFITIIVGFLIYGIAQIDWSVASNSKSAIGVDITRIDFGKMFNNTFVNVFMMMNIVLGLILLDKYLNNRNKKLMKQH